MGTERDRKIERGIKRQVLEEFGIDKMQANLQEMAADVLSSANAVTNLSDRHDGLVKKCMTESDLVASRLRDLNELRNRRFWGRLKWLLFGW